MARKVFRLKRCLTPGAYGDDVKKVQVWLNLVQLAYSFSDSYYDGIPEDGHFTRFITNYFYNRYLDMAGFERNHVYDAEIHEQLCYDVNMALQCIGETRDTWATR